MTSHDYNVTMKKIGVADLKAHLSEHLRAVRRGRSITVLDRDTPVARIVPYTEEAFEVRRSSRRPKALKELARPARPDASTDSLAVLLDDRGRR
jgi:prevent-host-death family protein